MAAVERSNAMSLAAIPNPNGSSGDFVLATALAYGLTAITIATQQNTAANSWVDLATPGPDVTVTIGTSGRALVIASAFVAPSNGAGLGMLGVSIDGAAPSAALQNTTGGAVRADTTLAPGIVPLLDVVTGLSAGAHDFKMVYQDQGAAGTAGIAYSNRTLVVWPF